VVFLWKHAGMSATFIIASLISGLFIGGVLGFIGAGGAMVTVPILVYIFDFTALQATTAALAVVLVTAISGLIPKFKSRDVLIKEAVIIWALGLLTNIGLGSIADSLSDQVLLIGFALVLISAAISMLASPITENPERVISNFSLLILSLIIGALTGLFGVGGGFVAIPVLVIFFHTPANKAAGTSLLIIALNCATAFLVKFEQWEQISWQYPIIISIAAIITASFASKAAKHLPTVHLKKAFAYLLFALAAFTIFTEIF
jgi:uncharacterized membrane protein YfcA